MIGLNSELEYNSSKYFVKKIKKLEFKNQKSKKNLYKISKLFY